MDDSGIELTEMYEQLNVVFDYYGENEENWTKIKYVKCILYFIFFKK